MDEYNDAAIQGWAIEKMMEAYGQWLRGGSIIPLTERVMLAEKAGVSVAEIDRLIRLPVDPLSI